MIDDNSVLKTLITFFDKVFSDKYDSFEETINNF